MFICAAGDVHGALHRLYDDVLAFERSLGTLAWGRVLSTSGRPFESVGAASWMGASAALSGSARPAVLSTMLRSSGNTGLGRVRSKAYVDGLRGRDHLRGNPLGVEISCPARDAFQSASLSDNPPGRPAIEVSWLQPLTLPQSLSSQIRGRACAVTRSSRA